MALCIKYSHVNDGTMQYDQCGGKTKQYISLYMWKMSTSNVCWKWLCAEEKCGNLYHDGNDDAYIHRNEKNIYTSILLLLG